MFVALLCGLAGDRDAYDYGHRTGYKEANKRSNGYQLIHNCRIENTRHVSIFVFFARFITIRCVYIPLSKVDSKVK